MPTTRRTLFKIEVDRLLNMINTSTFYYGLPVVLLNDAKSTLEIFSFLDTKSNSIES